MALITILLVKKRLLLLKLLNQTENKNGRKKKRFWVRKLSAERLQKGEFHLLVRDLRLHDHEYFFKYVWMSPTVFEELLSFVSPIIVKQSTATHDSISPSERLAVTLRYLLTGDAQCTVAASYRISPSEVSRIIAETCDAIWTSLKRMHYLDCPSNVSEWKSVAEEFESKWNFPHAVGALDGKHVVIALCFWLFVTLSMRCSRARRIIENAFGIATSRFRIFRKPIIVNTEKVILITRSVVALHNFVMKKCVSQIENYSYCPPSNVDQESPSGVVPGDWRKEEAVCDGLLSIEKFGSNNYSRTEKKVRDRFKNYFCSPE